MMICPNCGEKLNDNARFCSKCGAEINRPASTATEPQIPIQENASRSVPKKKKYLIPNLISLLVLAVIIFSVYQLFFKNEQADFPDNPHEFTTEQRASLDAYDLSEIEATSSGKLDGKWVIITGVHSFEGADRDTRMLPAFPQGSNLFTEIYYYSPQDFSLACLALAFDETTILGKCRYEDHNYSITDAILLSNDTLEPMISLDGNPTSSEQETDGNTSERAYDDYDVTITGDQLLEEAHQNTARTISNYAGKRVKITDLEIIYVDAENAWFDTVQFLYFRDPQDLYSVSAGSRVTVIGSIAEAFGTYCITDAILVAVETESEHAADDNAATDNPYGQTDNNESGASSNLPDENGAADDPLSSDAYNAGKNAAWTVYNTIFQYGYDCNKIVTFSNTDNQQACEMADGFYDEAVLMIGYTPYDTYTYNANTLTGGDYTVFLTQWHAAGIVGVYIPSTDQQELDSLLPYLILQANQLGYQNIYFFDGDGNDITMTIEEIEAAYS